MGTSVSPWAEAAAEAAADKAAAAALKDPPSVGGCRLTL